MTYVLCVRKCGVGYGWRVEVLRVVCLVCTACPSDFVLDKDAATRFVFFSHTCFFVTHLDSHRTRLKFARNPTGCRHTRGTLLWVTTRRFRRVTLIIKNNDNDES